ncbi:MAG TPA: cytochrome c [Bryobacteraceae bacterium]|jgi:mono/diheme cytochrome c family protein|nr:cytochrome c [Bryobacteraceae bacterium]
MGGIVRIAAMYLLTVGWHAAMAETPIAVLPINEESIAQMRARHPLASAEVIDPVYKRKQRYQGFWLRDVLQDLGRGGHPEADLYVRFRCKDGYLPIMPLTRALEGKGMIAIRDANAPRGENWQRLPASGTSSTLAPSYLVWISPADDPDEYPWPYQMVAIELISSSDALAGLDPDGSNAGQELFVTHCLKCHAINGVGGTFGPELNSPCSVTEYWDPRLLSRFIASASSIRAGTKMPNFGSLPEKDILAIVEYLRSMAGHKKPGAVCPSQ